MPWNAAGWGLFALGATAGWGSAGAWGLTVATLWGMGAALLLLTHAAWASPATAGGRASNRRVNLLPQGNEPLHLARRINSFLMVALAALIVSVGLGIATWALLDRLGAHAADSLVLALFVMPFAWGLLAYALLMQESRARQWRLLLLCAVPGAIALVTGLAA